MTEQVIIVGIVALVVVVAILVFRHRGVIDVEVPGFKGRGAFERARSRGSVKVRHIDAGRDVRVHDAADGHVDVARVRAGDHVDISRSGGSESPERAPAEP